MDTLEIIMKYTYHFLGAWLSLLYNMLSNCYYDLDEWADNDIGLYGPHVIKALLMVKLFL